MLRFMFCLLSVFLSFSGLSAQGFTNASTTNSEKSTNGRVIFTDDLAGDFELRFEWQGSEWQEATMFVFDEQGNLIQQETNLLSRGENIWEEVLQTHKPNVYHIEVVLENVLLFSVPLILTRK